MSLPNIADRIATALEAEAACVWANLAGAVVAAVAACVCGTHPGHVLALPATAGRVVIPRAHMLEVAGGSLVQLVRLGGAEPREVGSVDRCPPGELESALATAHAGLGVAGRGEPGLAEFAWPAGGTSGRRSSSTAARRGKPPMPARSMPASRWS